MEGKKCCALSLALTFGIIWAGGLLIVGLLNRFYAPYGFEMLKMIESVYPGYVAQSGLKNLAIGVGWAFADAFICGLLVSWIYNFFCSCKCKCKTEA